MIIIKFVEYKKIYRYIKTIEMKSLALNFYDYKSRLKLKTMKLCDEYLNRIIVIGDLMMDNISTFILL